MNKIKNSDYHFEYQEDPNQEDEQFLYVNESKVYMLREKL